MADESTIKRVMEADGPICTAVIARDIGTYEELMVDFTPRRREVEFILNAVNGITFVGAIPEIEVVIVAPRCDPSDVATYPRILMRVDLNGVPMDLSLDEIRSYEMKTGGESVVRRHHDEDDECDL